MNIEEAILTRRSVRRFLSKPVSETIVRQIIEVSARAPSGHNIQPWKVYAIAGEVKERLSADILKAAETEPETHQPEYEYYPTEWHEPYIGRRRELEEHTSDPPPSGCKPPPTFRSLYVFGISDRKQPAPPSR